MSQMFFSWDWGDGSSESGTGLFEVGHSWADGSSEGTTYPTRLTVSDGTYTGELSLQVKVLNRAPRQIYFDGLQAYAVTPLRLPEIFLDDDGIIVEHRWTFDEGVNIGGGVISISSDFSETDSLIDRPVVAWREPGLKIATIEVTDDDGNTTLSELEILVLNQRPVALFERPNDGLPLAFVLYRKGTGSSVSES